MRGSNSRHSRCKRDALPAELIARKDCYISILQKVKCNLLKKNPTIQKNVRSDFKIITHETLKLLPELDQFILPIEFNKKDKNSIKKNINTLIPDGIDFKNIEGLSAELKSKLSNLNPQHIHEASKIDGMTPSGLMLLISKINSYKKTA